MKYATGSIKNSSDNRDIKYSNINAMAVSLPSKHITDISMIPVLDQGLLGTCVAHAIACVKMYQEYKETGRVVKFSRRYIYSLARKLSPYKAGEMGLQPRDGAKIVSSGALEPDNIDDNSLPHEIYINYSPTTDETKSAVKWKTGYAFIDIKNINELKTAIVKDGVVTVTLDFQASSWPRSGKLKKVTSPESRHYITLYGYEDTADDTIFYFRNSWDTSWGDNGNGQFKYSDFKNNSYDAIVFTDVPNEAIENAKNTQYVFSMLMKKGTSGNEVSKLQERLKSEGYYTADITGFFGSVTEQAVIKYQKANKLTPADGIVGPKTRAKLNVPKKNSLLAKVGSTLSKVLKVSMTAIKIQK